MMIFADASLASTTYAYTPATKAATGGTDIGTPTVNEALSLVRAGGTINVRTGTYAELGTSHTCFDITKAMTLQAYSGEAVTLTYPVGQPPLTAMGEYGRIIRHNNNVTLDGLTIIGTHDEGDSASQDDDVSIFIQSSGQGAIRNCTFQKWGHAAIKLAAIGGQITIEKNLFQAGGFTFRDHHIYASADYSVNTMIIRHNAFTGAAGYGVHLYSSPRAVIVYGNVISDCVTGGMTISGRDHKIYNNTAVNNGERGLFLFYYDLNNLDIRNNIARGHSVGDLVVDGSLGTGGTFDYNDYGTAEVELQGAHDTTVDPQFAGSPLNSWDDYRLTDPGSPMIDAGVDVGAEYIAILDPSQLTRPTAKNQGASRDIGAFTT